MALVTILLCSIVQGGDLFLRRLGEQNIRANIGSEKPSIQSTIWMDKFWKHCKALGLIGT